MEELPGVTAAAAARNFNDIIDAVGNFCALFTPTECWNFFNAAEYASV
jgi:hypothetical protein